MHILFVFILSADLLTFRNINFRVGITGKSKRISIIGYRNYIAFVLITLFLGKQLVLLYERDKCFDFFIPTEDGYTVFDAYEL